MVFLKPMGLSRPFLLSEELWLFLNRMGLSGLEPPTSRLSGVRSNRLSYKPISKVSLWKVFWQPPAFPCRRQHSIIGRPGLNHRVRDVTELTFHGCFPRAHRHQKMRVLSFAVQFRVKRAENLFS